ncbi:MAG TPA: YceI family protein [Fibrobacteria bacterium]|nr:YceI family protein [Fibrobacteria bacterium]HOX50197.1 YceI family protein [Fibrobacteria bacterium]
MKVLSLVAALAVAASIQAQTWTHDAAHSTVNFAIKHLAVSTTRGEFDNVAIKLSGDPKKPSTLAAEVTIQAASVNTKNSSRDDHLRKEDFFDVAKYPEITFKSDKVESKGGKHVMVGTLTLHGVSKKVSIPFELSGPTEDPWKNTRIGLEGAFTLDRTEYGMTGGTPAVGKEVKIDISSEFTQAK